MAASEKIKTIHKKIDQNKVKYNLEREIPKISPLSSGNIGKYKFLTGKDVLSEKILFEKAGTTQRFECWSLGSDFKKQTSIVRKWYQGLDKIYKFDIKEENETRIIHIRKNKKRIKSNIFYSNKLNFF